MRSFKQMEVIMKKVVVCAVFCFLNVSLPAYSHDLSGARVLVNDDKFCFSDLSSAGVVMNDGEYCVFDKIEYLGQNGLNYIRVNIGNPWGTTEATAPDTIIEDRIALGKAKRTALPFSAALVSDSFNFDPTASTSFAPKPLFAFNDDTLIVYDYWALVEQPQFGCSLSVASDTLSISYLPRIGPVYDWAPTVESILKIRLGGSYRSIICRFNAVVNHSRSPEPAEAGFRDAGKTKFATITAPPLIAYKYRAHSYPSAMVYLHYEENGTQYRSISPRITVTLDSATWAIDSTQRPSLSRILSEELQWLAAKDICTPSSNTLTRFISMAESGKLRGEMCYWTKQDSIIALTQSFYISPKGLSVSTPRDPYSGCGLRTDFQIPSQELATTTATSPHTFPSSTRLYTVTAKVNGGMLTVASSTPFNTMAVYNLFGREMYSIHFASLMKKVSVPLLKIGCVPGNYIIAIGSSDRQTACRSVVVQR